jgi:TRAP transporter 4TM/12TM fusion protein
VKTGAPAADNWRLVRAAEVTRPVLGALISLIVIALAFELPLRLELRLLPPQALAVVLGLALAIVFLQGPAGGGPRGTLALWRDACFALLGSGICLYLAMRFPELTGEFLEHRQESFALGAVLVPLVIVALYRSAGGALVAILLVFLLYGLFGNLVPGSLQGRAQPFDRLLAYLAVDPNALFGLPLTIITTVVLLFILIGQLLFRAGGSEWFTDLAIALMGRTRGGSAKIAILASAFFGTISGSAVSNVASTGVLTIPLMKRAGYSPAAAGALEAVASTGGQIMPPIMGAAAFLMAELLQVAYADVMLAALLPALLYYIAVFMQADIEAARKHIAGVDMDSPPRARDVLREGWHFLLPFVVLIVALFGLNKTPDTAALWAAITIAVTGTLFSYKGRRLTLRSLTACLTATGTTSVEIIVIGAMAGIIIGVIQVTGLGFGLTFVLVQVGEGNLFLLLLLTAIVGIILGMGMPTTAVYLMVATLAAPPLIQIGVAPMAAHMFVLYFGILSMITPPVAIAAFTAANLAEAPAMKTALLACKYGWPAFIMPFLFVLSPALLLEGSFLQVAQATLTALIGVWLASLGIGGYFRGVLGPAMRVGFVASGIALLVPGHGFQGALVLELAGAVLGAALIGGEILRDRARASRV